jgi:phosphoribosylformimino-5-aminoimidazole carboxamide ribotide isomerase
LPFIQNYQAKVQYVICTDIAKDGMLEGPFWFIRQNFEAEGIKLIASGGIPLFDELPKLAELGCEGTIIVRFMKDGFRWNNWKTI